MKIYKFKLHRFYYNGNLNTQLGYKTKPPKLYNH
jgi:hypothetical protein